MDQVPGENLPQNNTLASYLDNIPVSREQAFGRLVGWADLCQRLALELNRECDLILDETDEAAALIEAIAADTSGRFLSAKEDFELATERYAGYHDPESKPLGLIGEALEGVDMLAAEEQKFAAQSALEAIYEQLRDNPDIQNTVAAEMLSPNMQQERMIKLNDAAGKIKEHGEFLRTACKKIRKNRDLPLPLMVEDVPPLNVLGSTLDDQAANTLEVVERIAAELHLLMAQPAANDMHAAPGLLQRITRVFTH